MISLKASAGLFYLSKTRQLSGRRRSKPNVTVPGQWHAHAHTHTQLLNSRICILIWLFIKSSYINVLKTGSLEWALLCVPKGTTWSLLITGRFRCVLVEHVAGGGFPLKAGQDGLAGLTWTRLSFHYMVSLLSYLQLLLNPILVAVFVSSLVVDWLRSSSRGARRICRELERNSKRILVSPFSTYILRSSKETRRWRSITAL